MVFKYGMQFYYQVEFPCDTVVIAQQLKQCCQCAEVCTELLKKHVEKHLQAIPFSRFLRLRLFQSARGTLR